jgi:succinyl-diaminopimelate desuccinylase
MSTDLFDLTTDLVATPSVSHNEKALADRFERDLRACAWLAVERIGDNVVARTTLGRERRIIMAGHLDTVPPNGNASARVEGDQLWGLGSVDMKGGLAVMLDLACSVDEPLVDVTWCFYACEEVGREDNGLVEIWAERPELLVGDAVILGEPTNGHVEAGCQGTMRAVIHLGGIRAHTARPFTGRNAIHRMAPVLTKVAEWEGRAVILDDCEYTEQLQAVAISGGVAGNVVPDGADLTVNYRFAPDRDSAAAQVFLEGLLGEILEPDFGDAVDIIDQADGAPPALDHPLLSRLVADTGLPPRAKVGWTDVASFWAHGVPAANFGPGDPQLCHHPDEHVGRSSLEQARQTLHSLLTT